MSREYSLCHIDAAEYIGTERQIVKQVGGFGQVSVKKTDSGEVVTIELTCEPHNDKAAKQSLFSEVYKQLRRIMYVNGYRRGKSVLVVGLGNEGMTVDALGAKTVDGLRTGGCLTAIKPSVGGLTGLDTFALVAGVVDRVHPDYILAVDTLATKRLSRLSRAVQLSDEGIAPGSGVDNNVEKLCEETLGCKVVAVGVPLVIYLKHLLAETAESIRPLDDRTARMVVAEKEVDVLVEDYADVISAAVNRLMGK